MNYLLSDLEHPGRRPAKINYFPTAASLTEKQIQWIEKNLQRDGNILIFSGDAGRFAGRNPEETLRRLTGMKIQSNPEQLVSYTYRTDRIPGANLIGIPGNSLWLQQFRGPLFHVEDPSASTVALLEGSERTGIALKRHPDWTAVYIGGSDERALTVDFWRNCCRNREYHSVRTRRRYHLCRKRYPDDSRRDIGKQGSALETKRGCHRPCHRQSDCRKSQHPDASHAVRHNPLVRFMPGS